MRDMSDRELLEAAAKAYWGDEIDDVCSIRWLDADEAIGYTHGDNQDHNGQDVEWLWNPITDDGDCARMESKLEIDVNWGLHRVIASERNSPEVSELYADHNGDKGKARRYASVRAATTIGQQEGE